ncbi:endonuclease/exonuclease/phosphatase family protein [uncultured Bradyrhizobium sp.]|uniref:endonuclease/exonuclease/phosphatase family protein n=1 Tax=uncultured Bradyrhizobium sp. TaxID=199684 RepID=UPI0035C9F53D
MRLITWNIQCGKGCDGVIDLERIVSTARSLADADVFCFQEVSDGFLSLDLGNDQGAQLAALLPEHRAVFLPAIETIDSKGRAHRFGNMTLSRLPVLQVASHLLPWPQDASPRSMRRQALEVTVQAAFGTLRVTNTHLEYYSAAQRDAQIGRLLDLQEEASTYRQAADTREPYGRQVIASSGILCGDFNFDASDPQHAVLHGSSRTGPNYRDAWMICHTGQPHQPTCGLYDDAQWPNGADCRDFIFVTEDLAHRICRVQIDGVTRASDHQPVLVELAD